jgi:hypothetical protein
MSSNDPPTVNEEKHIDKQTFGESAVRIAVSEETAEACREAHDLAQDRGGDSVDEFDLFVLNHTEPSYHVETGGGDEIAASAEYDPEAETPVTIELELPPSVDPDAVLDSVDIQVAGE